MESDAGLKNRNFIIWEAPRSRGTAISFAFYNGLKRYSKGSEYFDEPFHPLILDNLKESSIREFSSYKDRINGISASSKGNVIQKRLSSWNYGNECQIKLDNYEWMSQFTNIFLIRKPSEIIGSYRKAMEKHINAFRDDPNRWRWKEEDIIGVRPLYSLYEKAKRFKKDNAVLVIESEDLLKNPINGMQKLSNLLGVKFNEHMTHWNQEDLEIMKSRLWGEHWYDSFLESRGLNKYEPRKIQLLDKEEEALDENSRPYYELLKQEKITL